MADAGAFIKQEIEKKREVEAARAKAATLEERIKPVLASTAVQVIEGGLQVFAAIPSTSFYIAGSQLDDGTDAKQYHLKGNDEMFGPTVFLYARADNKIEVVYHYKHWIYGPDEKYEWDLLKTDTRHLFSPNERSAKDDQSQVDLGYSVLNTIGQIFSRHPANFAEGFEPAMKLIHKTYDPIKADAIKEAKAKLMAREARSWEPGYQPGLS